MEHSERQEDIDIETNKIIDPSGFFEIVETTDDENEASVWY